MKLGKNLALSDSGFVFNPSNGDSFSTNPIGMEIVRQMKEGKAVEDIKAILLKQYDIDEATMERDIQDFLGTLSKFKLTEANEKEND